VSSIKLPETVTTALSMLGEMTTPLSMIIIGAILAKTNFRMIFTDRKMYALHILRLVAVPLIVLYGFGVFIKDETMLGTLVILVGMPTAVLVAVLAARHGGDVALASKFVFVTTILSVITIPLLTILF
jgi:predicted permease